MAAEATNSKMVQIYENFLFPTSELPKNTAKLTQNIKNWEFQSGFNFSPELRLDNLLN